MLVRSPNGTFEFINYREKAPAAAYQDMFQGNTQGAIYGGLARYGTDNARCIFSSVFFHGMLTFLAVLCQVNSVLSSIFTKTTALFPGQL